MIQVNQLKNYVSYDPITGDIATKLNSNRMKRGGRIGYFSVKGYVDVKIEGFSYRVHRVAWALMTGEWPGDQIDHINGVRHDNRWVNLRLATNGQNRSNSKLNKNNSCGYKGVCFRADSGLYRAYVDVDGKRHNLGNFKSPEAASAAREAKAKELHGEFARVA